jgi:hypothetical protein
MSFRSTATNPSTTGAKRENVSWSGASFNLPVKVSSSGTDVAKRQFFYQTVNAIRNTATTYQNRLGALTSRFETGEIILKECKGHLVAMYDEDTRQPQWTHAAFNYYEPRLLSNDGRPVTLPVGVPLPGTAPDLSSLKDVAYIYFQFSMDPTQAYGKCMVPIESFKAAVTVPPSIRRNSVTPKIVDITELMVIKDVIEGITAVTGLPPSIGVLAQPGGQLWIDLIKPRLERDINEYYLRCVFEIAVQRIKEAFVGEVEDLSVQTEFEKCTQQRYNPLTRRPEELSVIHYYEDFSNIITGAPYDNKNPFPFDNGAIFFNGVKPTFRNVIRSEKSVIPKATLNELPSAALQRLTMIKDVMVAAEDKLEVIRSEAKVEIRSEMGSSSNRGASRKHMPSVNMMFASADSSRQDDQYDNNSWKRDDAETQQHWKRPAETHLGDLQQVVTNYNATTRSSDEAMVDAIIFLSVAEEALRKATRTTSPPDCWGCHGIQDLHDERWHLFWECPNKQREDVQTQFRKHV